MDEATKLKADKIKKEFIVKFEEALEKERVRRRKYKFSRVFYDVTQLSFGKHGWYGFALLEEKSNIISTTIDWDKTELDLTEEEIVVLTNELNQELHNMLNRD